MTKEFARICVQEFGTGTGPTMYRHFRQLAPFLDLPLEKLNTKVPRFAISGETINAARQLTDEEWNQGWLQYREETKDVLKIRLSKDGLVELMEVIRQLPQVPVQTSFDFK